MAEDLVWTLLTSQEFEEIHAHVLQRSMAILNGWERLWIFCSGILLLFTLFIGVTVDTRQVWDGQNERLVTVLIFLSIWAVLIGTIYVAGWAVGGIYRGFQETD